CGHRRRLAMRELGNREFMALILPEEISAKDALLFALEENLSHRAFNDAEKALALSHLCAVIPEEEMIRTYLPRLNLPPKKEVLRRYLRLSELEDEAFSALAGGELDPEAAEILLDFRVEDRLALLSLFRRITPGRNKRREIVAWTHELYKRDQLSVKSLLNEDDFRAVLDADNLSRPEKEKRIRSLIHARRFPNLKAAQTEQTRLLKKINLSKKLELHPPQNFEGLDFKIQITFADLAGFEARLRELERLVQNPDLAALIDLG
ncbi:MAG: hypothetical protein JRD68_13115, partial [Deltaproteobacteria bacterium]|nr:hypothetical protein [Deltaproteobacteria bacterium]